MTDTLLYFFHMGVNFFYMGGYGLYVWVSYGSVIAFLTLQWFIPWRRWKTYLREQKK